MRYLILSALFYVLSFGQVAKPQTVESETFETFVKEVMQKSSVPGLAVIAFNDERITYEQAFGRTDSSGTPVTLDTPFQLGSVSKSFSALIIAQLHAEGTLDLDAPVTDYLPELALGQHISWQNITLRQIVSHQSGLSTIDGNRVQAVTDRSQDAMQKAVRTIAKAKPSSQPGERLEYSNANYMLLAAVIEKLDNRSFEQAVSDRIFKPLTMTQSYVQMPIPGANTEAAGFVQWFGFPVQQRFIAGRVMMAPGGVTASARDLATYVRAVMRKDARIIPQGFASELLAPATPVSEYGWAYGFGWMFAEIEGEQAIFHSGLNSGFAAHAAFIPSRQEGVIVLTNISGSQMSDVPGVVARKALGVPTGPIAPTLTQRATLWGLTAGALTLLLGALRSVRNIFVPEKPPMKWLTLIVPSVVLLGLSYGMPERAAS